MDALTLVLAVVALFILFLMLTSGQRKHRLEQALRDLETERMRLKKSIEHVKLSYYQKKLDDKEAQEKIFEYEEKLREVEARILQLKDKPSMRALEKKEVVAAESRAAKPKAERVAIIKSETKLFQGLDTKAVVALFVIAVLAVMLMITFVGGKEKTGEERPPGSAGSVPVSARAVPEESTPPGGSGGLWVDLKNPTGATLEDLVVVVKAPEMSGIKFEDGRISLKKVYELEANGERNLFFPVTVEDYAEDGDYVLKAEVSDSFGKLGEAQAVLKVRIGAKDLSGNDIRI